MAIRGQRRVKIPPKPSPKINKREGRFSLCRNCFTKMERMVMRSMLKSPYVKDMAPDLGWEIGTVKFYRKLLFVKFGVPSVDEMLIYLLKLDLNYTVHAVVGEHKASRPSRIYTKRGRQTRQQYNRNHYLKHSAEIRERSRLWRLANPEKYKAQMERATEKRRRRDLGNG